jgi:mRNA interferase MazF
MQRGEIWHVRLPLVSGREQGGERPGIVLQGASEGQSSPLVIVIPLTSQLAALRFPGTLMIEPSSDNGLTAPSVAMVFQIRALDRARFARRIGHVRAEQVEEIFTRLDFLLGRLAVS